VLLGAKQWSFLPLSLAWVAIELTFVSLWDFHGKSLQASMRDLTNERLNSDMALTLATQDIVDRSGLLIIS
jgi:hypothetical protein